jgi:hypothetical protein
MRCPVGGAGRPPGRSSLSAWRRGPMNGHRCRTSARRPLPPRVPGDATAFSLFTARDADAWRRTESYSRGSSLQTPSGATPPHPRASFPRKTSGGAAGPLSRPCAPAGTEHSPPEQHGIDLFIPSRGEDGTRPPARRGGFPGAPHRPRGQWRSAALRDARRSLTTRFRFTDPCRARTSTGRCRAPSTRR